MLSNLITQYNTRKIKRWTKDGKPVPLKTRKCVVCGKRKDRNSRIDCVDPFDETESFCEECYKKELQT